MFRLQHRINAIFARAQESSNAVNARRFITARRNARGMIGKRISKYVVRRRSRCKWCKNIQKLSLRRRSHQGNRLNKKSIRNNSSRSMKKMQLKMTMRVKT